MSRTVWIVARAEWRLLARRGTARAAVGAAMAVMAIALIVGHGRARADAGDRAALQAWTASQRADLAAAARGDVSRDDVAVIWGPRSTELVANERGTYAVASTAPLAALTVGESDRQPSHYRITARLREAQLTATQLEHPLAMLVGHLDLAFVVVVLLPLSLIALGFDMTASERRAGTLGLLLARPVRLRDVVVGKLVTRSLVVLAMVGVAMAGALGLSAWSTETLVRLSWWGAFALAYAAFWLGLTACVDARGRSAPVQALTLVAVWLGTVVLLPGAIELTARVVRPSPSGPQLATAVRAATHATAVETGRQLGPFLEDHPASGVGRVGMQQYAALQEAREASMARRLRPTLAAFETQRAARRAFLARLRYLSPAMLAQFAFADIAGTSDARQQAFDEQAARFQQSWKAFFGPRLLEARPLDVGDYAEIPSFTFLEEPDGAIVRRIALPLTVLVCGSSGLFVLALRRYAAALAR